MPANRWIGILSRVTCWLLLAWGLLSIPAQAAGFDVITASSRLEGGVYRLNARLEYHFSKPALEHARRMAMRRVDDDGIDAGSGGAKKSRRGPHNKSRVGDTPPPLLVMGGNNLLPDPALQNGVSRTEPAIFG